MPICHETVDECSFDVAMKLYIFEGNKKSKSELFNNVTGMKIETKGSAHMPRFR